MQHIDEEDSTGKRFKGNYGGNQNLRGLSPYEKARREAFKNVVEKHNE